MARNPNDMKKLLLMWALLLTVSAPDMSVKDVAEYLHITPRTVYVMVADRRLKAYKLGDRIIRFRRDEIDAAMTPIGGVK
jgi:excisionase family DNA binding protein